MSDVREVFMSVAPSSGLESPSAIKAPTCALCGKAMQLMSVRPTMYRNVTEAHFYCECGYASDAMIADN